MKPCLRDCSSRRATLDHAILLYSTVIRHKRGKVSQYLWCSITCSQLSRSGISPHNCCFLLWTWLLRRHEMRVRFTLYDMGWIFGYDGWLARASFMLYSAAVLRLESHMANRVRFGAGSLPKMEVGLRECFFFLANSLRISETVSITTCSTFKSLCFAPSTAEQNRLWLGECETDVMRYERSVRLWQTTAPSTNVFTSSLDHTSPLTTMSHAL